MSRLLIIFFSSSCLLPSARGADLAVLEKKAKAGDAEAQYQLAEAFFWGTGVDQDLERVAKLARASAEQGNAKGQYRLAVQLLLEQREESTNENDKKGFEWLEKASAGLQKLAIQGDHDAQHKLALLYLSGLVKGDEDNPYDIDRKKAAEWFEQSANKGNVSSQWRLALIHRDGISGKPSREKYVEWTKKAADNGSAYAEYELWAIFRRPQGRQMKLEEAERYLTNSAKQGYAMAQFKYGVALFQGLFGGLNQKAEGIGWVKKAAKQGSGWAQLFLGEMLSKGVFLGQNHNEAFFWLTLAKGSKFPTVRNIAEKLLEQIRPGIKRLDLLQRARDFKPKKSLATRNRGLGLTGAVPDTRLSIRLDLFARLANKDNVAAMVYLGRACRKIGRTKEAIQWYKMAAKKDNKDGCAGLAEIFVTGNDGGIESDFTQGIMWRRKAAEFGDVRSMSILGIRILKGEVKDKDVKREEGVKWVKKAAENGYAPAQTNLGIMYIEGELMKQNFPKAKEWLLKATSQHFSDAQFTLGQFYIQGRENRNPNFGEAIKWYRRAAEQGHYRAQFLLSMMYMEGKGVKKDLKEGYKWLKTSSRYGMEGVDNVMAKFAEKLTQQEKQHAVLEASRFIAQNQYAPNRNGEGEEGGKDKLGVKELKAKANRGDTNAQVRLAQRYADSDGVNLDPVKAYEWYWIAGELGHDKAKAEGHKMAIAAGLTIFQRSDARDLANAWIKAFKSRDK